MMKKLAAIALLTLLSGVVSAQPLPVPRDPGSDMPDSNTIFHSSNAGNIADYRTAIDDPMTNANPNAVLFVTHNYVEGELGNEVPYTLGVAADAANWGIVLQDTSATIVENVAFNVQVQGLGGNVFQHVATAENIVQQVSYIDHPLTNGNPDALLFFTINNAVGSVYNTVPLGLWYDGDTERWAVFNQDKSPFPVGLALNVQVLSASDLAFVQTANAGNMIYSNVTVIDHPLLNNNPHAMLIVSQVWNPSGTEDGVYNTDYIGVWYDGMNKRWTIFNENGVTLADSASFNVHIIGERRWDNLTVNGSFEAPHANGNSQAAGWTLSGGAKRKCNKYDPVKIRSYSGECVLQMKGGTNAKAKQVVPISESTASVILSAALKGSNLTEGTTKAVAQLRFSDGSKFKQSLDTTALPSTEFAVRNNYVSLLDFEPLESVKLIVKVKSPTGKLFVDDVLLIAHEGLIAVRDVLPVPSAPDGWRAPDALD